MARDPQAIPQSSARLRPGARIGAVVSTFHRELTTAMLESARRELERSGLGAEDLLVVEVPGSFELPLVARSLAVREDVAAVMCFGLVLKGETTHDQFIANAASIGIAQVALTVDKPVLFGVLTCDTLEQARERALPPDRGGKYDKGREVARAAIETLAALETTRTIGKQAVRMGFAAPTDSPQGPR